MPRHIQKLIGVAATGTLLLVGFLSTRNKWSVENKIPTIPSTIHASSVTPQATPILPEGRSQHTENANLEPVAILWPQLAPLTDLEANQFKFVEAAISHYLEWGKMSPGTTEQFRSIMWQLGERAAAQYGRSLNSLRNAAVDQSRAEKAIDQIDMLAYFATAGQPTAYDAIQMLASRPIGWDASGTPKDWTAATITLEAFDVLAKIAPHKAAGIANQSPPDHRVAYITHYIYGRKLAGKISEDIKTEVAQTFGKDYVKEDPTPIDSISASTNQ